MRNLLVLAVPMLLAGCVPHRDVPLADIPKLTTLGDVMFVQANLADPQFKKIGAASYGDADWPAFKDAGERLVATTQKVKDSFSKGPEFDALATQLQDKAKALIAASDAKDAKAASATLAEMKTTCKTCHKKFR